MAKRNINCFAVHPKIWSVVINKIIINIIIIDNVNVA